ncbi:LemA family protein [uncultured Dubosiella sp.]|uniref:LemA family protein n=1 Tax=uncultured Dubosiella sp. TaxID=1937011 RepID=UPI00260F6063|nr:LemA family protein [uncultured Dubosiella sp.]
MNKRKFPGWATALIIILVIVLAAGISVVGPYNTMVGYDEQVTTAQSNIQTQLQSRLDKINELMPAVQGAMNQEDDIYKDIAALRSNTPGIQMDADGNMTIENNASLQDLENADAASSQMLRDINVAVEAYPELKSTDLMKDFMTSVEGIENRISYAREQYNEDVQEYNVYIRSFPHNIAAGLFGFSQKDKFEASTAAQNAPTVKFD